MPTIVGRNVKVEIALTFAASIAPTAITKADPPSVTSSAHGLVDGDTGYFTCADGMVELDQQAVYVDQTDTNNFTLPGLDSRDYSTAVSGQQLFFRASTWATLAESASYSVGGGEADQLDDGRLLDAKRRNVAGFLSPENLTISVRNQDVDGAALQFLTKQARRSLNVLVKISRGTRVLRVAYGQPSVPGEDVQAGQLATGSFSITVPAYVVKPNHV